MTLPPDFYLIDVSLLDDIPLTVEGKVFTAEKYFFIANWTLGKLVHWSPIAGVPIFSPKDFWRKGFISQALKKYTVKSEIWNKLD